ncbi:sigma factor-like helix-turn-helix DNA-binding protein [Corynebacterium falsenii]|uniref:sigma factor-like helix-turn-helix DNA-binding protein n=1 Tax=Corynebacterium falsenii TaxID=108486 RepID=UPI00234C8A8C|nr:sigma factor-like helix-turn-helix DNA-binding protein [Corynebacterium falsenii]MDC7104024.1 sigma factor-like helix-turn-helix DNA-binding protein [Corynebacterium falsenii]
MHSDPTKNSDVEDDRDWQDQLLAESEGFDGDFYTAEPLSSAFGLENHAGTFLGTTGSILGWYHLVGDVEKALDTMPEELLAKDSETGSQVKADAFVQELFELAVGELVSAASDDERKLAIVTQRWLGDATLDDLGTQFGVTRERIRQLESKLLLDFEDQRELFDCVAAMVSARIGSLTLYSDLCREIPALQAESLQLNVPFESIFRLVTSKWCRDEAFVMSECFPDDLSAEIERSVDEYGVSTLQPIADRLGVSAEQLEVYIQERLSDVRIVEDYLIAGARSYPQRVAAYLSIKGAPCTIEEALAFYGEGNPRSASNQLSTDPRLLRASKSEWALAEWGLDTFTTIAGMIGKLIDETEPDEEGRKSVPLDRVIEELRSYKVKPSSVRAYSSAGLFKTVNGRVYRITEDELEPMDKDPQDCKGLYRVGSSWSLLCEVSKDHLRGSGVPIPSGIAAFYGMKPLEELELSSHLGSQYVRANRVNGVSTSTIRRFCEELKLDIGERIFLEFRDDRSFAVSLAPAVIETDDEYGRLYSELGIPAEQLESTRMDIEEYLAPVKERLGLSSTAPRRRVVAIFRHRNQNEWADWIMGLGGPETLTHNAGR